MKDDLKKISAFYVGAGIGLLIVYSIRRGEQVKREEIAKDIDAINRAASVIVDRIRRGVYEGKTIAEIHQEFEFEQVAQHEDNRDLMH